MTSTKAFSFWQRYLSDSLESLRLPYDFPKSGKSHHTAGQVGETLGTSLTTAYPSPDAGNGFVMADGNGDLRKYDEATVIGSVAWLLGGNASPASNILGTTTADDLDIRTNNVNVLTLTSGGAITQGVGAGQVTLTGNVDAQNGLDVTNANLTVGGTNFVVDASNGNTGIGENADASFALSVNGTSGVDNVRMRSLSGATSADEFGDRANDGVIIADGDGVLRKVPLPGEVLFGRVEVDQAGSVPAAPAVTIAGLSSPVTPGMFEFEVYVQYSGTALFDDFNVSMNGSATFTDISYGVVSSGQAISPSNVDGVGSEIMDIGTSVPATNRQTILIKGFMHVTAAGTVEVQNSDASGITYHRNSYIRGIRLQ